MFFDPSDPPPEKDGEDSDNGRWKEAECDNRNIAGGDGDCGRTVLQYLEIADFSNSLRHFLKF